MIPARRGTDRTVIILTPKFTSKISSVAGPIVRVVVKGKVAGDRALQTLVPFMQALSESGAGADPTTVTMEYGLTKLTANLLELKVEDR